jgi:hypothetical protein
MYLRRLSGAHPKVEPTKTPLDGFFGGEQILLGGGLCYVNVRVVLVAL